MLGLKSEFQYSLGTSWGETRTEIANAIAFKITPAGGTTETATASLLSSDVPDDEVDPMSIIDIVQGSDANCLEGGVGDRGEARRGMSGLDHATRA